MVFKKDDVSLDRRRSEEFVCSLTTTNANKPFCCGTAKIRKDNGYSYRKFRFRLKVAYPIKPILGKVLSLKMIVTF